MNYTVSSAIDSLLKKANLSSIVNYLFTDSGGYLNNGSQTLSAANFASWALTKPFVATTLTADNQTITLPSGINGNEGFLIEVDNSSGYVGLTVSGFLETEGFDAESDGYDTIVFYCQPLPSGAVDISVRKVVA